MQLTAAGRTLRDDAGFTLIELLLVIVLLGLITVPLAALVVAFSHNANATSDRLAVSRDAQIAGAFLARDVAGAGLRDYSAGATGSTTVPFKSSIEFDAAYDAGGHTCGTAATPIAAVRLLADDWDPPASSPTPAPSPTPAATATLRIDIVAYYLSAVSGGRQSLHRIKCVGSAPPVDITVVHNVDAGSLSVTCSPTCGSTPMPDTVTVAFTVSTPITCEQTTTSGCQVPSYPVTLTGQRRQT
jgi:prepilin-type N-terminal cleavage/methylation domain-containing protein